MKNDSDLKHKWGGQIIDHGWTSVPNLLLKNAKKLEISPIELLILIYLMRFWWRPDDLPFPSISKTSEEIGITRKTASKYFNTLKDKKLISEVTKKNGQTAYSLQGLIEKLQNLS